MGLKEPSELDIRAAKGFPELANESKFFSVECRFRRIVRTKDDSKHVLWSQGADEFTKHFGPAANYFAGAVEYVRLATGWGFPYKSLHVMVFDRKKRTSGGMVFPAGHFNPGGDMRLGWANGEFTLTVLHELVHVFKIVKPMSGIGLGFDEDWVEQQALKLTMGV